MLIVETIGRIRREHLIKGKSIKEIARDLKISRNTVRKVLRSGETSFSYEREIQPRPKLGRWKAELDRMLTANTSNPARERLTLIRLFEELRALGYEGGYDAVRRYARSWSREHASQMADAYVPLTFAPGEAYQFDWSHEIVVMNGVTTIVKVAHVRLCHSRMMFVRAYPRETQEMVFDAHERAFAFFKGACTRGIYDNMKTAVETIFVGKDRQYNRRFLQMCAHHLVEPVACTPASGWEKGQVENQVGLVRERFFTPRLKFKTYDELNAWLTDKVIAYAKAHPHPERPEHTIWEMFEEERPKLVAYRGRFDGFHALPASVSKTCLVRFDNNKYSGQRRRHRPAGENSVRLFIRQQVTPLLKHSQIGRYLRIFAWETLAPTAVYRDFIASEKLPLLDQAAREIREYSICRSAMGCTGPPCGSSPLRPQKARYSGHNLPSPFRRWVLRPCPRSARSDRPV